jgi:MFS family permease
VLRLALSLGLAQVGFHAWIASLPVALAVAGRPDAEIGAIVGSAAIFNVLAALAAGGFIDRFGGRAIYLAGVVFLAAGAAPVAASAVDEQSAFPALIGLRLLQGVGLALVLPAVMTLVPGQVSRARLPTAVGVVGVAGNVSLALTPALSLGLLERFGLPAVGLATCASLAAGAAMMWPLRDARSSGEAAPAYRLRPSWRPSWAVPLAATFLFVAHWGVVSAYLPQRAVLAGADVGLFFMADALGLLALRVPAAWLAGRIGSRFVVLAGVAITVGALSLLLLPAETPLLIVSGALTGVGSAFFFPVIALELTLRSDGRDRGSAMSLNAVAFGAGIALGSIAVAPLFALIGFELAMLGGIALTAGAGILAARDRSLGRPAEAAAGTSGPLAPPETPVGLAPAGRR